MRFIEEVVVDEFLPTLRSMLAEALRERGLTQREVADALGISQSAVSKYAHGEVERNERILGDERVVELVERVADGLASGEMTPVQALVEIEVFVRRMERGDLLAELHEEVMPELAGRSGAFSVHDPESELRAEERVLASLRRGLRILGNTRGVADLVPNVGSNLVECTPEPRGIDDVAGVPGRLFDVKGRLAVPGDPEFGASEHVATVLLAARDAGSEARAALNVRYDPAIVEGLESRGLDAVSFDAEYDDVGAAVREAVESAPDAAVLYQTGAFGIEPIVYVLAPTAEAAAEHVRALCRSLEG